MTVKCDCGSLNLWNLQRPGKTLITGIPFGDKRHEYDSIYYNDKQDPLLFMLKR